VAYEIELGDAATFDGLLERIGIVLAGHGVA
jgi:hypothetical protein